MNYNKKLIQPSLFLCIKRQDVELRKFTFQKKEKRNDYVLKRHKLLTYAFSHGLKISAACRVDDIM